MDAPWGWGDCEAFVFGHSWHEVVYKACGLCMGPVDNCCL